MAIVAGTTVRARAELVDRVAAIVSEAIITSQRIDTFISLSAKAVEDRYGNQPEAYRQQMQRLMDNGLETLVQRQLILHDFENQQGKVPESIIDEIVQETIRKRYPDRVNFTKKLQSDGMTLEQFRKQIRDELIIDDMTHQFVKEPIISPHKIEAYYNEHRDEFKIEEEVKTRMIVLNQSAADDPGTARKRAEEILSQIKGGASFDEMAKVYSAGPERTRGASTDWVELSKLAEPIRVEAARLKPGECSGVIESKDQGKEACFLVMLDDRRPAHFTPLNEVRDDVEKTLMVQESGRLHKRWIDRLKKKTFVRYF